MTPTVKSGQRLAPRTITSLFNCERAEVQRDNLPLKEIGITAIERQVCSGPGTPDEWRERQQTIYDDIAWIKDSGFDLLALGDDICREQVNREWLKDAEMEMKELAIMLRRFGNCVGVEMVDESDTKLNGWEPTELRQWWTEAGGPPMTWPNHGPSTVERFGDYTSRQWQWWNARRMPSYFQAIKLACRDVPRDKRLCCLINCAGIWHIPTWDSIPPAPDEIMAQVWIALAFGASQLRFWSYDPLRWREQRKSGDLVWLTGCRPGDERWGGLLRALETIKENAVKLQGEPFVPVYQKPWLYGRRGQFRWKANTINAKVVFL